MPLPIFLTFSKSREINSSVILPYIKYLAEKQGVKNIFGKFESGILPL